MVSELVQRLHAAVLLGERTGSRGQSPTNIYNLADEAADRIEALEAERDALIQPTPAEAEGVCQVCHGTGFTGSGDRTKECACQSRSPSTGEAGTPRSG
jgi:mono/diheme cytochrome c family protein